VLEWVLVLGLAAVSLGLNLANRDFPLAYHPDETKKVQFIQSGEQDWKHPILLLRLGGGAAALAGASTDQDVAEAGRAVSGVLGVVCVLLTWALLRRALEPGYAMVGTALVALAPLLVVHAHYLKEDVLLLACCLASLLALVGLVERMGTSGEVPASFALGIATGLAVSSHYKGGLLVAVYALVPLVASVYDVRAYYRRIVLALGTSVLVFLFVNSPLLLDPLAFVEGVFFEARHAVEGHHVYIGPLDSWFTFHLFESLIPGLTVPVMLFAGAGFVVALATWRTQETAARILLLFGGLSYVAVELSPLKPYPGFARYVVPTVPAIALAACLAVRAFERAVRGTRLHWIAPLAVVALLVPPALRSGRLVEGLQHDTRVLSDRWLEEHAQKPIVELYASGRSYDIVSLTTLDVEAARRAGTTHVAASSFLYDRFARGSRLAGQKDYVYSTHEKYQELFSYPYVEFRPETPSFAFSNPTIRVVDIREPRPPGRAG